MRRAIIALFVLTLAAFAANIKLYLKDGGFHLVREYQVQTDRVRYYSVERSQWEEMPLDLVDLKRTESEVAERQSQLADETKVVVEEEKAVREVRAEVAPLMVEPALAAHADRLPIQCQNATRRETRRGIVSRWPAGPLLDDPVVAVKDIRLTRHQVEHETPASVRRRIHRPTTESAA